MSSSTTPLEEQSVACSCVAQRVGTFDAADVFVLYTTNKITQQQNKIQMSQF
jgi:hypothetical protein